MREPGIQSLERAVAILRVLAQGHLEGVRLAEVTAQTGLSRSTAHRITSALIDLGLVDQEPSGRLFPGLALLGLGAASANRYGLAELAAPFCQRLADRTGDTIYLSLRRGNEVLCVDRVEGAFPIKILTWNVGDCRPLGINASGLAIMASLSDAEVARITEANASRVEDITGHDRADVLAFVERTRREGYAFNAGFSAPGMAAVNNPATHDPLLRVSVADVVRQQLEVGIDVVNDGEFGKSSWAAYVLERVTGFEIRRDELIPLNWLGRDRERFADFFAKEMPSALTGSSTEVCVGPITYRGQALIQRDLDNLRSALPENTEAFCTAVAPASTGYNARNEYYSSDREYVYAIADALEQEYHAVIDAGLLLQVDDAVLANMYDYLVQQSPAKYREWAQLRVDALKHALRGIPEDRVRYHVCFGSWHVPHVADAPLEAIIDLILQVRAGAYSIEAANPRHEHEWRVWESHKLQ